MTQEKMEKLAELLLKDMKKSMSNSPIRSKSNIEKNKGLWDKMNEESLKNWKPGEYVKLPMN